MLAKGQIELEPEMTKAVQIGRSVISFTVKPFVPQPSAPALLAQPASEILKTPSPQKSQSAPVQSNQQEVEEMLRRKIEETNDKIS